VDELVRATQFSPAGPLVEARTRELVTGLARSLQARGIDAGSYLELTGQSPETLEQRLRAEATMSVARELVLDALADELDISVDDEEVVALVREQTEDGEDAAETIQRLRESGQFERLRDDLRLRAALDQLATEVKRIPVELAKARDSIWTPEKERPATTSKLWTPGSKETT
jgi:trigger factor